MLLNKPTGNREDKIWEETPISDALRQLTTDELSRHKLIGLMTSRGWAIDRQSQVGQKRLLENMRREAVAGKILDELGRSLDKLNPHIPVGLLKGPALWGDIYRPGEREASDIDLFVDQANEARFLALLVEYGFDRQYRSTDRSSNFKTVCLSERFGDLSIEVHTKLWWREPSQFEWTWRSSLRSPFNRLTLEDQFIHLCGHWIAQHTMISMHWLVDIALFLNAHGDKLNVSILSARAKTLNLERAVQAAREICRNVFDGRPARSIASIDLKFLRDPRGNLFKYFWFKHSLQDSWWSAIFYDVIWLTSIFQKAQARRGLH